MLRYGGFYGPGTSIDAGGEHVELIRKRRFPIGGGGAGMWSLVHIDDAAAATVAAIEGGPPGIYNVVDDAPAPVVRVAARARRVGRRAAAAPAAGLARAARRPARRRYSMMTRVRGASNAKAKRELGWAPAAHLA